jgi:mono/diheme cytochrome c family protein
MGLAESGQAIYQAHCQMCHGAKGVPNPGMAKMLGIPSATSPAVKNLTAAQMFAVVKNGKAKMPALKGQLSDAQIQAAVAYFRTLTK